MVEVQNMFLKMNKGVVFNQNFLNQNGLDGFLRVPMSIETFDVPAELSAAFAKQLNAFKDVEKTDSAVVEEFLEVLKKHDKLLHQYISSETIGTECFE